MKIYTYAIVNTNDNIDDSIRGLEGIPVYNIPFRDIGIIASEINGQIEGITKEHVLMHEEVVERLMEDFTVLPVKFLTIFNKKDDILYMMKEYYDDFKKNLDRLKNKVEFGIKVIWPGDKIWMRIKNNHTKNGQKIFKSDNSPGKSFIIKKYEEYKIEEKFQEQANRYVALLDNYFNGIIIEKRLQKLRNKNLLLNASYLIEKEKQSDFKEAFERLRIDRVGLKYLFSGPWPPYNFVILTKGTR